MDNNDKARELCDLMGFTEDKTCLDAVYRTEVDDALVDMARWKDEQFVKEKQELIDKIIEKFEFENFTFVDIDGSLNFDYAKFSEFLEKL